MNKSTPFQGKALRMRLGDSGHAHVVDRFAEATFEKQLNAIVNSMLPPVAKVYNAVEHKKTR